MVLVSLIKSGCGQSNIGFLYFLTSFRASALYCCLVYCPLLLTFALHWAGVCSTFCPKLAIFALGVFFIVASDYLLDIGCGSVAYFNSVSVKDLVEWICLGKTVVY